MNLENRNVIFEIGRIRKWIFNDKNFNNKNNLKLST